MTKQITFELCRGFTLDDHFVGTFQDALQRGDRLASRVGNVSLYAYNEDFHTWEPVGTFLGHMRLKNLYGDIFIIKSDYTDIVKATNSAKFRKKNSAKFGKKMKGDKYKVAASQHKDRVQLALLDRRIEDLQNLCSLLEKSGDKKSADKNVVPKLNEAIMLRDQLLQEADANRRIAAKWLLMVFVSCDIAADAADAFSDVLKKISRGYEPDNDFAKLVKQQADKAREASKGWAKIVEILDDSKDYSLEMYYADMAEDIQSKVLDLVGSEVEKVMATEKGQRMF